MYQYKSLEGVPLNEMSTCLNLAFSDYPLPIHLSEKALSTLFSTSGVDSKLSFGAFFEGTLVGFIFNSSSLYQGRRSVFDVGTGVIPAHRGKQIFTNLFALAQQTLKQAQIERYYLEVLQQNKRAVSLYKKHGFAVTREFVVLSGSAPASISQPKRVQYASFDAFNFQQATCSNRNNPSYEHSDNILKLHPEFYHVAYIHEQNVSAFCIFSKATGQILQLSWNNIYDLREIVLSLLAQYRHVTVKNIESSEQQVLEMLSSLEFKVITKQYEMARNIS